MEERKYLLLNSGGSFSLDTDYVLMEEFLDLDISSSLGSDKLNITKRVESAGQLDILNIESTDTSSSFKCNLLQNGVGNLDLVKDKILLTENMVGGYCVVIFSLSYVNNKIVPVLFQRFKMNSSELISCSSASLVMDKSSGRQY